MAYGNTLKFKALKGTIPGSCSGCNMDNILVYKVAKICISCYNKQIRARRKQQIFNIYGKVCKCCGETNEKFLTLDHINSFYKIKEKRPHFETEYRNAVITKDHSKYRILCYNCNIARAKNNDVCPHQEEFNKLTKSFNLKLA